jgi:hypothetical protein
MNHRPFEDWLLSGDPLSAAQMHDLHEHLNACDYCTALGEVNTALRASRPASPAGGFVPRFEARLQLQQARQRKRTFWGVFFLVLASAGLIIALALRFIPYFRQDLLGLVVAWVPYLVSLFTSADVIGKIGAVLIGIVAGFIPAYAWVLAAFLSALFGWLWVVSISRFAKLPQGA